MVTNHLHPLTSHGMILQGTLGKKTPGVFVAYVLSESDQNKIGGIHKVLTPTGLSKVGPYYIPL